MGALEDIYAELDADVSEEEFREAVEAKVEQMGGLADEESAAMIVAHEIDETEINGVADIDAGMEEAKFVAKVTSVGDLRTFERDDEDEEGRVLNAEVADETGTIRITFWDEQAAQADSDLETGQVLRIAGHPRDGYRGVEVSVNRAEPEDDVQVEVDLDGTTTVDDLSAGASDVNVQGVVLDTSPVRTFDRDDGSEGRVGDLVLGDETGRVRVTLWDDRADRAEELDGGETVEITDGYVRERDDQLELHVGDRGRVEEVEADVDYEPEAVDIADLELDQTADVAGVVRSADPKRTFDRDDGSEGQVRNVRVQDDTGDIRVALWGDKADLDVGPGDEVLFADVQIQDGWQDDLEASANWQSSVVPLADGATTAPDPTDDADATDDDASADEATGLDAFGDGEGPTSDGSDDNAADATDDTDADGDPVEFTGVVVQAGDPVILDDGEQTMTVETDADVTLGQEVTARGTTQGGRLDADDLV